ncbi:MAG: c-type cytochrome [Pseudolabrys sp.]|nr:c-type cytochrome [Pseudolabrys sp.]
MQVALIRIAALLLLPILIGAAHGTAQAQLRGHGGPVRALAISADGKHAISGSFDTSAIRWSLERQVAEQVMRGHDAAVNAVVYVKDGRIATAGADGKIAIWTPGKPVPDRILEGHKGPIVTLAVSPDGQTLASGSWDRTIRLWPLTAGKVSEAPRVLEGNSQNVNGVAFTPDGQALVSAGYDATLRIWSLAKGGGTIVRNMPTPLNTVAVAPDGEIIAAGATGKVFFVSAKGNLEAEIEASPTPVIDLAISPDGKLIAAAGIRGSVAIIDRKARTLKHTLVGPGLPVWSVAFFPDSQTILTGGTDRTIRRWNAANGGPLDSVVAGAPDDPLAAYKDDHGAQVFRACVACHTLTPDEGNKAGPSLAGIFGRKIGSLPGFRYSEALQQMDIVWTPETVAKMFEVGPMKYTPGTKMPEQKIGSAEDRQALMEFLKKATVK